MEELKRALPAAFDPKNQKKDRSEQRAYNIYEKCEEALRSAQLRAGHASATSIKKRAKQESGSEVEEQEEKCLHIFLLLFFVFHSFQTH